MRSLVTFSPGPAWIDGKPAQAQDRAVIGPHLVSMRGLYERGILIFGGPTAAGLGGMALLETSSLGEAAILMDQDPAIRSGVMIYTLDALNPYFDAFSGEAWSPPS